MKCIHYVEFLFNTKKNVFFEGKKTLGGVFEAGVGGNEIKQFILIGLRL